MGAIDQNGVMAIYGTGQELHNFNENFRSDGKRFDFSLGSGVVDYELYGYFACSNVPDDEMSGKGKGGKHSSGSSPKCYDIGVGDRDGKTRLRLEENHPDYFGEQKGVGGGVPLGSKFVGYLYVFKNEGAGVRCQVYQDAGDNEVKPSNQWKLIGDWLETAKHWQTPPSDHQGTIRQDGPGGVSGLKWKWLGVRVIKSGDVAGGAVPGGGTGGLPPFVPTSTDKNGDGYNDTTGQYEGGTPNNSTGGDTGPTAPGSPEPIPEPEIITVTKKVTMKWSIRTLPTSCNSAEDTEATVTETVFECPPGSNDPITSTMDMHVAGGALKIGLYVAMDKSMILNDLVKSFTNRMKRVGTAPGEFWWEIWDDKNNLIYITPPDKRVLAANVDLNYVDVTIEDFKNQATLNLHDRLVVAYNAEGSDVDNKLVVKINESEDAIDGEKTVLTYYGENGWVVDPKKNFTCKLVGRNWNP